MEIAQGSVIGNYRILRPLGKGGMGTVYEVEHVKLGVRYALKAFDVREGEAELFRTRFAAEGKCACSTSTSTSGPARRTT